MTAFTLGGSGGGTFGLIMVLDLLRGRKRQVMMNKYCTQTCRRGRHSVGHLNRDRRQELNLSFQNFSTLFLAQETLKISAAAFYRRLKTRIQKSINFGAWPLALTTPVMITASSLEMTRTTVLLDNVCKTSESTSREIKQLPLFSFCVNIKNHRSYLQRLQTVELTDDISMGNM